MAGQVRADWFDLLFDIWEATFGVAGACSKLNGEDFDNAFDPKYVWEDEYLEISFYRDGVPKDENDNDNLSVAVSGNEIFLQVFRYQNNKTVIPLDGADCIKGWVVKVDDDEDDFFKSAAFCIKDFITDPGDAIAQWKKDAAKMIAMLSK